MIPSSEKPLAKLVVVTDLLWATVLPHSRHISSLLDLTPLEHRELAEMLSTVSVKYDNLFLTSFAYSMGLHQRPVPRTCHSGMNGAAGTNGVHAHLNGNGNGHVPNEDEDDVAHMHFHFSPPLLRSASVRKFLVGYVDAFSLIRTILTLDVIVLSSCPSHSATLRPNKLQPGYAIAQRRTFWRDSHCELIDEMLTESFVVID